MVGAGSVAHELHKTPVLLGFHDINIRFQRSIIWRFLLGICWHLLHVVVSIVNLGSCLVQLLRYCVISTGILKKYRDLQLNKLRYLAVVVDSEEAKDISKTKKLLHWLSDIGVKHVILYDMEGVLKKSEDSLRKSINSNIISFSDFSGQATTPLFDEEKLSIELLSFSDGKEGVAKAASVLCSKYLKDDSLDRDRKEPVFTELNMANALREVGYGGPEPDLLLVFAPTRCHLGFPAWRMRYTEIVHMGPLKSMKYGAIVKAIYDLSRKRQNYGS